MNNLIVIALCVLVSGCSVFKSKPEPHKPPVINYELSNYGLPMACVEGEEVCRALPEEDQRRIVVDLLNEYGVDVKAF